MQAIADRMAGFLQMDWLTGPILDKELRVSSRRRRNYFLRSLYVLILVGFTTAIWVEMVAHTSSPLAWRTNQLAVAGMTITAVVVWIQFLAGQIVAGVALSTSISDEVYHKTLGVLMTTPINSFQIVMGKLFSKLLQVLLLMALSLPLLAIIRIFGGVPWDYLLSSLCITVSTVIFVGSLSLFFSIFSKRAYVVILLTLSALGVLFLLLPLIAGLAVMRSFNEASFFSTLYYLNPYIALTVETEAMTSPRGTPWLGNCLWWGHCATMLAGSALILLVSTIRVRRVALAQIAGGERNHSTPSETKMRLDPVRAVTGPAVLWKESRRPLAGRHKTRFWVTLTTSTVLVLLSYVFFATFEGRNHLDDQEVQALYIVTFASIAALVTATVPATTITTEKESQSWPLLLTTTLSNREIIFGKWMGSMRRVLPAWIPLFAHMGLFTLVGYIHPLGLFQMVVLAFWLIVLLTATGTYLSLRFRRTTTAVVMNYVLHATVWGIIPLLLAFFLILTRSSDDMVEAYMDINPVVHLVLIIDETVRVRSTMNYYWPGFGQLSAAESTLWMLVNLAGYCTAGALFIWRAACNVRRNPA